jgi:hypothetical protein
LGARNRRRNSLLSNSLAPARALTKALQLFRGASAEPFAPFNQFNLQKVCHQETRLLRRCCLPRFAISFDLFLRARFLIR